MKDINLNINFKIIFKKYIYKKYLLKKAILEKNNCSVVMT
jgi:hypothetical protein